MKAARPPGRSTAIKGNFPSHVNEAEWSAALPKAEKTRLESIGLRREITT